MPHAKSLTESFSTRRKKMTKDEFTGTATGQNNARQKGKQGKPGGSRAAQTAPHLQPPAPRPSYAMPDMPRILPVAKNIKILDAPPPPVPPPTVRDDAAPDNKGSA
jgi:hypothetical protein